MSLQKFSINYTFYVLAIGLVAYALPILFPQVKLLSDNFWLVFGYLSVLTYIAYVLANFGIKRNPEAGVMAIMGSITLKLLFALGFVLVYSLKSTEKDLVFVLNFFSLYLLFTFFELYGLLRNLRHQNK